MSVPPTSTKRHQRGTVNRIPVMRPWGLPDPPCPALLPPGTAQISTGPHAVPDGVGPQRTGSWACGHTSAVPPAGAARRLSVVAHERRQQAAQSCWAGGARAGPGSGTSAGTPRWRRIRAVTSRQGITPPTEQEIDLRREAERRHDPFDQRLASRVAERPRRPGICLADRAGRD